MKTFQYHLKALKTIFTLFSKGKFIIYFIPGILITIIFYSVNTLLAKLGKSDITSTTDQSTTIVVSALEYINNQFYTFFILIVLSPVNSILSKKLDTHLTEYIHSTSFSEILNNILRMIFVLSITLFFEFVIMGVWWLFALVTGLDFINSFLYILVAAFFYGFSFYDYNLERYNRSTTGSLKYASNHILSMLIAGGSFMLLKLVPFIGFIIAPIVITMLTTIVYLYSIKKLPKRSNRRHSINLQTVEKTNE
jgi:CysZ protein